MQLGLVYRLQDQPVVPDQSVFHSLFHSLLDDVWNSGIQWLDKVEGDGSSESIIGALHAHNPGKHFHRQYGEVLHSCGGSLE